MSNPKPIEGALYRRVEHSIVPASGKDWPPILRDNKCDTDFLDRIVTALNREAALSAAPARGGVRSQSEEWCAGYEAGVAQEREKHTDPMKWLENAFSTYKVMIRTLYEHRLKKGRDWCEQQSCWPESQYWQGYHNALADQQAKTAPWESSDYVRVVKEQADGQP